MSELQIPADARRTRTAVILRDREVGVEDAREAIASSRERPSAGAWLDQFLLSREQVA